MKYLVFILLILVSCNNSHYMFKKDGQPGIMLSFDDRYPNQWFDMLEMLNKYDAFATFFVTQIDSLTTEEIEKLESIQSKGHEIGFHGAKHVLSEHYIKRYDINTYIKDEIVSGINRMNKAGFYPTSFAYPYSAKYWYTDSELLKYFYILRSTVPLNRNKDITLIDDIYYSFDGNRLIYSVSIDKSSGIEIEVIERAIQRVVNNNEVLMLHAHQPGVDFDVRYLEHILMLANKYNLVFYTVSDLVR